MKLLKWYYLVLSLVSARLLAAAGKYVHISLPAGVSQPMFTNIMDTSSVRNIKFRDIEPLLLLPTFLFVGAECEWLVHLSTEVIVPSPWPPTITRGVSNEKCSTHSYIHRH